MDFNKGQIDQLLDDVSYLQDEAEAFKYVINTIPYEEKPAGKDSILEMIAIIDYAQKYFYRPFVENAAGLSRKKFEYDENYRTSFKLDMDKYGSVENLLNKIIKHRAALLSALNKLNALDWHKKGYVKGKEKPIFQVITEMVEFERSQFRQIADRVMAIENNRQAQSQAKSKAESES